MRVPDLVTSSAPRGRSLRAIIASLVLLVVLCVSVGAAPAMGSGRGREYAAILATGAPCTPGWSDTDTSFPRSILASVVNQGESAWSVGLTTVSEDPRYPLAVRWDGDAWDVMPIVASSEERALFGVDRSADGRLWAVGYTTKSSAYHPMLMRWDGSMWRVAGPEAVRSMGGALLSVRALSDEATWAVGYQRGTAGQGPLAIRRVGATWQEASPPIATGETGVLTDIDVLATDDAWAVGWATVRGTPQPYLAHWDGTAWKRGKPELAGSEGALTAVTMVAADDAWAVGYRISGGRYRPTVQHWNGRAWRVVTFPSVDSPVAMLRNVRAGADGEPLVVGTRWDAASNSWQGLAAHLVGDEWYEMDAPTLVDGSEPRDLAIRDDGTAWVVGSNGPRSFAALLCPEPQGSDAAMDLTTSTGIEMAALASDEPGLAESPAPEPEATEVAAEPSSDPEPTPHMSPVLPEPSARPRPTASGDAPSAAPQRTPRPTQPQVRAAGSSPTSVARDMAEAAGLQRDTPSYGAVRADFDRDGWPDLFIGRHSNVGWLVRNGGDGTFSSTAGVTIPRRDRHGCTSGDANGDKRPDLYCANGALHGAGFKSNELYIQQADGTFVDESLARRATDPFGRGRLAVFFDLDHDKYADLFLADRPDRVDGLPSHDRILANEGGTLYADRSVSGIDATSGADCLRAADVDGDGWQDIVRCARATDRPNGYGIQILRNDHGRLVDVTATSGIQKRRAVDAVVADIDGDGLMDIVEVTADQLRVHLRRGKQFVLGYTRSLKLAIATGVGDVDGDGDRDIYIAQGSRTRQQADLMLLNRGDGGGFSAMAIPQVTSGSAESVTPIDYDRNGLMDFLVLNGNGALSPGPVQLIAFFPAP